MIIRKICILGGTGFVGRSLANQLSNAGYEVRILTRNRDRNKGDLILLPKLELIETDIHNPESLTSQLKGCDAVINLVGILNEPGTNGKVFRQVHVDLTQNIINACVQLGIKRLLQMSSLNAAPDAPSHYLRSKGEAENLAHSIKTIKTTSYRPAVIFGPGDSFFNRFATLLRLTPVIFPLACSKSRFAPVFIGNLTEAMTSSLEDPHYYGQRLEICGPEIYTLMELVKYTARCIDIKRIIFPLPDFLAQFQAALFDMIGFLFHLIKIQKPFSRDNYLSLQLDSTTDNNALPKLGISPTAIDAVVPQYLANKYYKSRYDHLRQSSHRNS
jgi:nucleoside-diphosphate-sugar epimerase